MPPTQRLRTAGLRRATSDARSTDGYYTLTGRKSDLIISGGFNIYPREIEDFLMEQAEVAEAAVVGEADRGAWRDPGRLCRLEKRCRRFWPAGSALQGTARFVQNPAALRIH